MNSFRMILVAIGLAVASIAHATPVSSSEVVYNVDLTLAPAFPNLAKVYFSTNLGAGAAQLDVGESLVAVFYGDFNGSGGAFDQQIYALSFATQFASFSSVNPAMTDGVYSVGLHVIGGSIDVQGAYGHALTIGPCCEFSPHYTASLAANGVPVPTTLALVGIGLLALRLRKKRTQTLTWRQMEAVEFAAR